MEIEFKRGLMVKTQNFEKLSLKEFLQLRETKTEKFENVHEVIKGACLPFFDYDAKYNTKADFNSWHQQSIITAFNEIQMTYPKGLVMMFDSSGAASGDLFKISAHFIVRGAGYYKSPTDIEEVAKSLRTPGFDTGVYRERKTMRMPFCIKDDEPSRMLVRVVITDGKLVPLNEIQCEHLLGETYRDWVITNVEGEKLRFDEQKDKRKDNVPSDDDDDDDDEKPVRKISKAKIKSILEALDVKRWTDYDSWLKICWAMKHTADEQGYNLLPMLQKYSKQAPNYNKETTEQQYCKNVNKNKNPVTIGTLILWAREDSPEPVQVKVELPADISIAPTYYEDKVNLLSTKPTEEQIQRWMLGCLALNSVNGNEEWYIRSRSGWNPLVGNKSNFPFATLTSGSKYFVEVLYGKKTKSVEKTFKDCLSELINTIPFKQNCVVNGVRFYPYFKESELTEKIINQFSGWPHSFTPLQLEDEEIKIFNDHVRMLFGNCADYFLKLIAHRIQKPRVKIPMLTAYSKEQGAGKSSIQSFLTGVFGKQYCLETTGTEDILGKFNALCEGKLITFINEAKEDGKSIIDCEAFKSRITEVSLTINEKYKTVRVSENWSSYIMWTNNKHSIPVSNSDRRTVLIDCCCDKVGNTKYFKQLYSINNTQVHTKYFNWLAQMDLTNFDPNVIPETEIRTQAKEEGLGTAVDHIRAVCEGKRDIYDNSVDAFNIVNLTTLYQDYRNFCQEQGIAAHFNFIQKRYKEQLCDKLGLESEQHKVGPNKNIRGYLIDTKTMLAAFRKLTKNPKFQFDLND